MAAIKLKRRNTGSPLVSGTAPLNTGAGGILSGEAVWDNVANILYIGGGDDGSGNSTAIKTVAGTGIFAPLASPVFTGTPTAPTAVAGTNTTQLASTAFVAAAISAFTPSAIDGGVI